MKIEFELRKDTWYILLQRDDLSVATEMIIGTGGNNKIPDNLVNQISCLMHRAFELGREYQASRIRGAIEYRCNV